MFEVGYVLVTDDTTISMAFGQDKMKGKRLTIDMIGYSIDHWHLSYDPWKQLWPAHRPSPATWATKGLTVGTHESVIPHIVTSKSNSIFTVSSLIIYRTSILQPQSH